MQRHQQNKAMQAEEADAYRQEQVAAAAMQAAQPSPPPSAAVGDPTVAELERLSALKSQGALTDDEFAAAKRRLLGL